VAAQLADLRVDFAVGEHDLGHRHRLDAPAAGVDRRVRARHLERRDADRQAAQRLGRIAVELRGDPHVLGGVGDLLGADVEGELLVDGVVGLHEPFDQVHAAAI
jgi:hypothetical protein